MKLEIYHQLGFRHKWNIDSLKADTSGDGVIIAPKHLERSEVVALPKNLRGRAIFDPQFYVPAVERGKLGSYDFFPNVIADGFQTDEYEGAIANKAARRCVKFQCENAFRYIVIPTRHVSGMPTNFAEQQEELFIEPFLSAAKKADCTDRLILQVALNSDMVKDQQYADDLLDWITGIQDICGVYLIIQTSPRGKQIKDLNFLIAYLKFVDALVSANLDVILGYLNTEALLLTLANPHVVTIGSYENTRMFNPRDFNEDDGKQKRSPNARIYYPKLLQNVDYQYRSVIDLAAKNYEPLLIDNKYKILMFEPDFAWHFQKSEIYKHAFVEMVAQLRALANFKGKARYDFLKEQLNQAMNHFLHLSDKGVVLDPDSDGSHLPLWLTAANHFALYKGWAK